MTPVTFGDNMLISTAFAQAAGAAPGPLEGLQSFLPLVLIFGVFYFLLIRPQQKRAKQHQEVLSNLRRGDKVISGGGIYGTVTKIISDTEVEIEIALNTKIKVVRSAISEVLTKPEPVAANKDESSSSEASS